MLSLMLACCFVGAVDVTATDLAGAKVSGQLVGLSDQAVTLTTAMGEKVLPIEQLVDLRWPAVKNDAPPPGQVYLIDGSVLSFASLTTASRQLKLVSPAYGDLTLPLSQVRAIRFGDAASAAAAWAKLLERTRSKDLLILPKKSKPGELDPTTGVVGSVTDRDLKFVLGGDEIPIKLTRVYGVIYARKPVAPAGAFVVEAGVNDRIVASSITWQPADSALELKVAGSAQVRVGEKYLRRIDCSGGKIRYLDEMKPVFHDFASVLPDKLYKQIFHYRVNETMDGQPMRLGGRKYDRGLWMHSKTTLRYALGGEYSRFEAVTGIDDEMPRRQKTKARLTIKADDRVLFDEDIWITDKPRNLKLDVTGARTLEIVVGFGETRADGTAPLNAAMQDWVDLADAKVMK